ncbi:MAG: FAD/NAD(P)-binding protein, partial [Sphingomicrobium sp.]
TLDGEQQRRFLRHARPWWDVHRHRIAPEVAAVLKRMIGEGRLEIVAGRIKSMREEEGKLVAGIQRRARSEARDQHFALGVNCTGPLGAIGRSEDGVLKSLFEAGMARPDGLGMGLDIDGRSRVAGAKRLWAVGPLTKGRFWEIVAVPDIRGQVADVADDIARELDHAAQS